MKAVETSGCFNTVKLLCELGADVNAKTIEGKTALMIAAESPDVNFCINVLLESGADVNTTSKDSRTALIYAAIHCYHEGMVSLLAAGADVNAICSDDHTTALFTPNT